MAEKPQDATPIAQSVLATTSPLSGSGGRPAATSAAASTDDVVTADAVRCMQITPTNTLITCLGRGMIDIALSEHVLFLLMLEDGQQHQIAKFQGLMRF